MEEEARRFLPSLANNHGGVGSGSDFNCKLKSQGDDPTSSTLI